MKKLARISVQGVVQGVGFRPFVFRLAGEHKLNGWVRNTSGNVEIEVEGNEEALKSFISDLQTKTPPMARIEKIKTSFNARKKGYSEFQINESLIQEGKYQLVSPDIATCGDCRREIFDPADRRFRYPFTNCTNCGPRFTIIEDIPYDRPKTTMREFRMCPLCQHEYDDPSDRRFHAQPNACPVCGPSLKLVDAGNKVIEGKRVIEKTASLLKEGKILALRGLGGFHLACDATNSKAVSELRVKKRRPDKPFAIMLATIEEIEEHCQVTPEEKKLLQSPQCPIVLLRWTHDSSSVAMEVAPNLKYMGVMLPYTPLHHLLLNEAGIPLVMTSGNLSEEPIAKDNDEAFVRLKGIADYFLLHNRGIYARYDDSVCIVEGTTQVVRRARSYAPYPIFLPFKSRQILSCGAEEKNTFCLTRDDHAFVSQHIGDLENEETLEHFENTVELYKKLFRVKPDIIAYDMHPEYLSTKYAIEIGKKLNLRLVPVQHHHAHIASCMAENKVKGPVIGVAFDGIGYGADGTLWGGEFLIADWRSFKRAGHLEHVLLAGGSAAIKKPYRMALSYLYTLLGYNVELTGLPIERIGEKELAIIKNQLKRKVNSPLTSSAGRLFDAVSALAGVRESITYEAQAAIELEMLAPDEFDVNSLEYYPFSVVEQGGIKVVKLGELISAVVQDVRSDVKTSLISLKFHNTVAQIIVAMCKLIAKEVKIDKVALSGGVFQNRLLFRLSTAALKKEGFKVLTHKLVPCNDGGISLGQAVIANFTE